jgi:hypothetical protein
LSILLIVYQFRHPGILKGAFKTSLLSKSTSHADWRCGRYRRPA